MVIDVIGKSGEDLYIKVPKGTIIKEADTESMQFTSFDNPTHKLDETQKEYFIRTIGINIDKIRRLRNVDQNKTFENIDIVYIKDESELRKNKLLQEKFSDLSKNLEYSEEFLEKSGKKDRGSGENILNPKKAYNTEQIKNNLNLENINLNGNDNLFFTYQYYDEQINKIINNTETFILYLEKIMKLIKLFVYILYQI